MRLSFRFHTTSSISPSPRGGGWSWRLLLYGAAAVIMLLVVRFFLLGHIRLANNQHALVSLTYYGLRLPGESLWGYHRWGYRTPERGDTLVYTLLSPQGEETTLTGVCNSLPGETIWIDPVRQKFLPARTSPDARPITIPRRGQSIRITPYNARFLAFIMQHYEHCQNVSISRQGQLLIDGSAVERARLLRDYYWIETHNDSFLIIPHDALVGRIVLTK